MVALFIKVPGFQNQTHFFSLCMQFDFVAHVHTHAYNVCDAVLEQLFCRLFGQGLTVLMPIFSCSRRFLTSFQTVHSNFLGSCRCHLFRPIDWFYQTRKHRLSTFFWSFLRNFVIVILYNAESWPGLPFPVFLLAFLSAYCQRGAFFCDAVKAFMASTYSGLLGYQATALR